MFLANKMLNYAIKSNVSSEKNNQKTKREKNQTSFLGILTNSRTMGSSDGLKFNLSLPKNHQTNKNEKF